MTKKALVFSLFMLCSLGLAADALAFFDFQAQPRRGGNNIRFESGGPGGILRNEEVTFTFASDVAAQYRMYLTLYQPLTDEQGHVIPQDRFIVFSPSNPLGTLRTQQETPVTMGQMPVFTSNAAGDSDEFVLVFNVRVPEDQPGGVYRTQITFTAEPVTPQAGITPRVVTMDVRVEIAPDFRITIQNTSGGRELNLGRVTKERPVAIASLKMLIDSNLGSPYKIFQQVSEPLVSQEGVAFDEDLLRFRVTGGSNGSVSTGAVPEKLPSSSSLIYTSSESGGGDTLELQYQSVDNAPQKAGIYAGVLTFRIESSSPFVPSQTLNVPVRIEIEPILDLEVQLDTAGSFHFGTFRTGDEKQERKAKIVVHSNLGQPYQVTQILSRKLTNDEGAMIPEENFLFYGSEAKTGTLAVMSPSPVKEGDQVVFTSDRLGTPEEFSLNYVLTVPREAHAGSYRAETVFSITTL